MCYPCLEVGRKGDVLLVSRRGVRVGIERGRVFSPGGTSEIGGVLPIGSGSREKGRRRYLCLRVTDRGVSSVGIE